MKRLDASSFWNRQWLDNLTPAKRTALSMVAGSLISLAGIYTFVVRPLTKQVKTMAVNVQQMSGEMDRLAGFDTAAGRSSSLLAELRAQEKRVLAAEGTLDRIEKLNERIANIGTNAEQTTNSLAEVDRLNQQANEISSLASSRQADLKEVTQTMNDIADVKNVVMRHAQDVDDALITLNDLRTLQERIEGLAEENAAAEERLQKLDRILTALEAIPAEKTDKASENLARLLAVHDSIADSDALQLEAADHNLRGMLGLQKSLAQDTGDIVDAVENLELLRAFQTELSTQLASVKESRMQLMEVTLLNDTVQRVAAAVGPLVELSSLNRLDDDEVRAMARRILNSRTVQSASVPRHETQTLPAPQRIEGGIDRLVPEPVE